MKRSVLLLLSLLASIAFVHAQAKAPQPSANPPSSPPPPVFPAPGTPQPTGPVYVYDQKPMPAPTGGRPYLIAPEQAQGIINRFKDEYKKEGSPRFLISVNRDLMDGTSGLKLSSHKQVVETTPSAVDNATAPTNGVHQMERTSSTNIYRLRDRKESSLADRQTERDIERLFGRPLRLAGVQLADQQVATQLTGDGSVEGFTGQPDSEQTRTHRPSLTNIADVVLEILVSSREVPGSDPTPDLQATAIRLRDAKILGQVTAADLIGQGANASKAVQTFGIREIVDATALSLMEDMLPSEDQSK